MELSYQPGFVYHYDYSFLIQQVQKADANDHQEALEQSKIGATATVHFSVEGERDSELFFKLEMDNFHSDQASDDGDSKEEQEDIRTYYNDLLKAQPVFFTLAADGLVKDVRYSRKDNDWARDLKKGVISLLQLRTVELDSLLSGSADSVEYHSETDTTGSGLVGYSLLASNDSHFVIRKVKNRENFHGFGGYNDDQNTIEWVSTYSADYTIGRDARVIERIDAKDEHFMSFTDDAGLESDGVGALILISYEERMFFAPFPKSMDDVLTSVASADIVSTYVMDDLTLSLVEQSADEELYNEDFVATENFAGGYEEFYKNAALLAKSQWENPALFQRLALNIARDGRLLRHVKEEVQKNLALRPILIDLIIGSCREDAIHFMLDDIVYNHPENVEELIRAMTITAYSTYEGGIVKTLHWIMDRTELPIESRKYAALSLGAVIYKQATVRRWLDKQAHAAIWALETRLKEASTPEDLMLYIHAVGNMGQESSVPLLQAIAENESHSDDIRSAAVYALRRMPNSDALVELSTRGNLSFALRQHALETIRTINFEQVHELLSISDRSLLQLALKKIPVKYLNKYQVSTRDSEGAFGPLFEYQNEIKLVGNGKFGARLGFRVLLNNPLQPADDGADENVLFKSGGYARVDAFKSTFNVLDTFAVLGGDIRKKQLHSFVFISVGDVVWRQCFDLIGSMCSKRPSGPEDGNPPVCSRFPARSVAAFNAPIVRTAFPIPLVFGLTINTDVALAAHFGLAVESEICGLQRGKAGSVSIIPRVGLDIIAGASINVFFARAGVSIDAKLMYTDFKFDNSLVLFSEKMNAPLDRQLVLQNVAVVPVQLCTESFVVQNSLTGRFYLYAQIRNRIVRCGKRQIPCWLEWGSGVEKEIVWNGFKFMKWSKRLYSACKQFGGGKTLTIDDLQ